MCGIVGLRPTHGRYPNDGIMSLTIDKFDQCGPLARSITDLALFDSAVTGESLSEPLSDLAGVRIGFVPEFFLEGVDESVESITREIVHRLREAGATIVDAALPAECHEALANAATIIAYENIESISSYLREYGTGLSFDDMLQQASPLMQSVYRNTAPPARGAYEEALLRRSRIRTAIGAYYAEHGVAALLFPSILCPPPPLGDNLEIEVRGRKMPIRTVMGRNTALGSIAGLCSVVLPGGRTPSNLPIGIEFLSRPDADRELLALTGCIASLLDR
jgi:indoleacetamide hydrolase